MSPECILEGFHIPRVPEKIQQSIEGNLTYQEMLNALKKIIK